MAVFIKHLKKYFSTGWIFSESECTHKEGNTACSSFFENRKNYTGFYMDIGTHHPYPFSNTSHFTQKGWQKITIEPTCGSARLFNLFSNARTVNKGGSAFEIASRSITVCNTIVKTVNVREMPLAAVLDNNLPVGQTIDFLSLDVAGFDMRALKSIDWNRYAPLFIIVKANTGIQGGVASICSFLMQKNYGQVAQTDRAFFFKHNGR